VKDRLEPPEFIQAPESVEILEGASAAFTCTVRGKPVPKIAWMKDSKTLKKNKSMNIENRENEATLLAESDLTVKAATIDEHDGTYVVEASSEAGSAIKEVQLIGTSHFSS
jgi:hypothetical protein